MVFCLILQDGKSCPANLKHDQILFREYRDVDEYPRKLVRTSIFPNALKMASWTSLFHRCITSRGLNNKCLLDAGSNIGANNTCNFEDQ